MAVDGKVRIGTEVDSEQAKKDLEQLGKDAESSGGKIGTGFKTAAKVAAAFTAAAVAASAAIISVGSNYETSLAKLGTIADTSKVSTEEFASALRTLSSETGVAASDLADVAYNAISAGTATEDAVGMAATATKLATAGFTDAGSALSVLTTALNSYGDSAGTAQDISDSLITVQNLGVTTVSELASAMGKAIATGSAYGVSLGNLESAYISLTKGGINTAESTTYMSAMMNELGKSSSTAAKTLKSETGKSFSELMAEGKSLGDVLGILYDSVGNSSDAMMNMWGSAEAGKAANAIINQGLTEFNENLNAVTNSTGATETAYSQMADTFENKSARLKQSAVNLMTTIYQDMYQTGTKNFADMGISWMSSLQNGFETGGMSGLATAAMNVVTQIATSIAGAASQLGAKGAELISNLMTGVQTYLPQLITLGTQAIAGFIQGFAEKLPELVPQALSMVVTIADAIISNIPTIVNAGISILTGLVQGIINSLPTLIKEGPRIINQFSDAIYKGLGKIVTTGIKLIAKLGQGIIKNMPLIIKNSGQILMAIINAFSLAKLLSLGKALMTNLGSGIKSMMSSVGSTAKNLANNAMNAIKNINWKAAGTSAIKNVAAGIKAMLSLLKSAAVSTAKTAINGIKSIDVKSIGTNIIKGIMSGIKSMAGQLASSAVNAVKGAVSSMKSALGIHSPSKVTQDQVGHQMTAGVKVAWESDADDLQKTADKAIEEMIPDASDYEKKLEGIRIPDVTAYTTLYQGKKSSQMEITKSEKPERTDVGKTVKEGIKEGMKNLKCIMDGREVGHIVAPHVNEELAT